ncbi:hypothetical protein Tco_0315873 [Tanacetum coccineum]
MNDVTKKSRYSSLQGIFLGSQGFRGGCEEAQGGSLRSVHVDYASLRFAESWEVGNCDLSSNEQRDVTPLSEWEYTYPDIGSKVSLRGSNTINRGLIQAIPTSLPLQPIGEATKASNLQRILPGVQRRSHFTYFLYLIFLDMENEVDISALTMEQYTALIPDDIKPGIVNFKIGDDIEFEIYANFYNGIKTQTFHRHRWLRRLRTCAYGIRDCGSLPLPWGHSRCHYA